MLPERRARSTRCCAIELKKCEGLPHELAGILGEAWQRLQCRTIARAPVASRHREHR